MPVCCYCFCQCRLAVSLLFIMLMLCHNRRFTDHRVSGIPANDPFPLRVDSVSPTPFSRLPHTALNCYYWSLSSSLTAFMSHVILNEWLYLFSFSFLSAFFNIQRNGVLTTLFSFYMAGDTSHVKTEQCCRLGASSPFWLSCFTIGWDLKWCILEGKYSVTLV